MIDPNLNVAGRLLYQSISLIAYKPAIKTEKAEKFLSTTYKNCQNVGITPGKIISHIEDLTEFSDQIRLPEIEQYIKQKVYKKEELDRQLHEGKENVYSLKREAEEVERRRDQAFEEQRKAGEDFRLFNDVKVELKKHNVSINDVPKFARAVKALAERGFQADTIIANIEEMFNFDLKKEKLKAAIHEMETKCSRLNEKNIALEQQIDIYSLILPVIEISISNGIPYESAVSKFISDIRTHSDSKLGIESKIEDLKYQPSVYATVNHLYSLGLENVDILQLGKVYLNVSKTTYSVEDMAAGLGKIVDMISSMTKSGNSQNEKVEETLRYVSGKLSQLHSTS